MVILFLFLLFNASILTGQAVAGIKIYSNDPIEVELTNFDRLKKINDSIRFSLNTPTILAEIYKHKGHYYLMYPEFNYCFEISDTSITQLYKGEVHGNNFGRVNFFRNDTLFSYGGGGIWNHSPDISYLDRTEGLWKKYEITGKKPVFEGSVDYFGFYHKDKIYAYFFLNESYSIDINQHYFTKDRLWIFDFNSKTWTNKKSWDYLPPFQTAPSIKTNNFIAVYSSGLLKVLFDKRNFKFYNFPKFINLFGYLKFPDPITDNYIFTGDKVYIFGSGIDKIRAIDFLEDFNRLNKSQFLIKENSFNQYFKRGIFIFSGFFMVIFSILVFLKIQQIAKFPYLELLKYSKNSITQEEIDEFFKSGTTGTEDEKRKTRADKIEVINNLFKDLLLIERTKDSTDKRIFLYEIKLKGSPAIYKTSLFLHRQLEKISVRK